MTKNTLNNEVDKDSDNDDLEKILASLVDKNGVCKTCGQDHSFRPTFQDTKASIDVMPQVFRKDQQSDSMVEVKI
jgi:hypothetical protein